MLGRHYQLSYTLSPTTIIFLTLGFQESCHLFKISSRCQSLSIILFEGHSLSRVLPTPPTTTTTRVQGSRHDSSRGHGS